MKKYLSLLLLLGFGLSAKAQHHPPHNMLLRGQTEVYASHVVYKSPHNFQVELELELPPEVKGRYIKEVANHPDETFFYLLQHLHIGDIQNVSSISGSFQRENAKGERVTFIDQVELPKSAFKILYFYELPLNL